MRRFQNLAEVAAARVLKAPRLKILFLAAILLGAIVCANAAGEKPFPPAADVKGDWSFTAAAKLPNVLIIGDSISIGYTRLVRGKLAGQANVYRPMCSKGPSRKKSRPN